MEVKVSKVGLYSSGDVAGVSILFSTEPYLIEL